MGKCLRIGAILMTCVFSIYAQVDASASTTVASPQDFFALKNAAEKGDARAQLAYGKALESKSREEAGFWVQKAAAQGLGEAWHWLGYAGLGKENTVFYYEKAVENGYPEALADLLNHLLFYSGPSVDFTKAKKFADLARKLNSTSGLDRSNGLLETIDRCYEAGSVQIPSEDRPSPAEQKTLKSAKPECMVFHYGLGVAQDWQKYRKCLLAQDSVDYNYLAEIYANAWGVKRNPELALALVCHAGGVPSELMGMVDTLYRTKDQERLEPAYFFCDHISSGMNSGFCSARAEKISFRQRAAKFAEITKNWTQKQQGAFLSLRKLGDVFFAERAVSEQDMSGTARGQIAVEEEARLKDAFFKSIQAFEAGQFPKDANFSQADRDLNAIYSRIMKRIDMKDQGTITKEGIRATERKWLHYRDAWVLFASTRYASLSPDLWKTWLTQQRIQQLKAFAPVTQQM